MKKFPKSVKHTLSGLFSRNKKKIFVYYTSLNVASLGFTFWLWKGMMTSSDTRYKVHTYCDPLLSLFYRIYGYSSAAVKITREDDIARWTAEKKL